MNTLPCRVTFFNMLMLDQRLAIIRHRHRHRHLIIVIITECERLQADARAKVHAGCVCPALATSG